jgi:hypothetical protein
MKRLSLNCSFLCAALLCASAQAQMAVNVTGTIEGMVGTEIIIKQDGTGNLFRCDTAQQWRGPDNVTYRMPGPCSVNVTGTEIAKNLRPGYFVQFQVTLANKRTAVTEVKALTIVTVTPASRVGILTSDPVEPAEANEEDEDDAKTGKRKPAENLEECLILGQITKARNGTLTVAFPGEKGVVNLSIKVTDDATIDISSDSLAIARVGDKITASGQGFRLPHFLAREVAIEHSPALDEKATRGKPKIKDEDAKPEGKPGDKKPAFGVGDPDDDKPEAGKPAPKAKVKLEVLKIN